jgi:hypothetical protein
MMILASATKASIRTLGQLNLKRYLIRFLTLLEPSAIGLDELEAVGYQFKGGFRFSVGFPFFLVQTSDYRDPSAFVQVTLDGLRQPVESRDLDPAGLFFPRTKSQAEICDLGTITRDVNVRIGPKVAS